VFAVFVDTTNPSAAGTLTQAKPAKRATTCVNKIDDHAIPKSIRFQLENIAAPVAKQLTNYQPRSLWIVAN